MIRATKAVWLAAMLIPLVGAVITLAGCAIPMPLRDIRSDSSFTQASVRKGNIGVGGVVHSTSDDYNKEEDEWAEQLAAAIDAQHPKTPTQPIGPLTERIGHELLDKAQDEYGDGPITPATLELLHTQVPDVRYLVFGRIRSDEVSAEDHWVQGRGGAAVSRDKNNEVDFSPWKFGGPPRSKRRKAAEWQKFKPETGNMKRAAPASTPADAQPHTKDKDTPQGPKMTKETEASPKKSLAGGDKQMKARIHTRSKSKGKSSGDAAMSALGGALLDALLSGGDDDDDDYGANLVLVQVYSRNVVVEFDVYDLSKGHSVWTAAATLRRGPPTNTSAQGGQEVPYNPWDYSAKPNLTGMLPTAFDAVAYRLP